MSERRGTKALELWCKRMTEGYPGVKVENMTTSWRDGLAFCAIIHHFRPELIDFSKLNKEDVFYNNDLAFTVAEKYLGIPALLEPEDMVEYDVPDRLSILTYLSQFYKAFVASQGSSPARIVPKRPANSSDRGSIGSPASTSPPTKMAIRSAGGGIPRREPCAKCGNPVYIAERLTVGKLLYHRTCFRCARCNSQLTLANYYETETPNQFCCETCPDEESKSHIGSDHNKSKLDEKSMLSRSLSDEEKSAGLKNLSDQQQQDEYSREFEAALEESPILKSPLSSSEYAIARTQFLAANLVDSSSDTEIPPELPKTKPPDIKSANNSPKTSPIFSSSDRRERLNSFSENNVNTMNDLSKDTSGNLYLHSRSPNLAAKISSVNNKSSENKRTNFNSVKQLSTASSVAKSKPNVTKDKSQSQNESNVRKEDDVPSLVKNRMKMFEKSNEKETLPQGNEQSIRKRVNMENLKRPLADAAVTPPEKKFSLEKNSAFLKLPSESKNKAALEMTDSSIKPNRGIAESQVKSLNLMLQKQIALKEGKITPKSLMKQTRAESSEETKLVHNLGLTNKTNALRDTLRNEKVIHSSEQFEKRKSAESLLTKSKFDPTKTINTEKKSPSDDLTKSLSFSNRRNSSEENKTRSFSLRKIETPSERISNGSKSISIGKIGNQTQKTTFEKISPQRERPLSLNAIKKNFNTSTPYRLQKQQSMEEIPKLETNRMLFNMHLKDGRKENLFQNKYKSAEKLENYSIYKRSMSDIDTKKKIIEDNLTPIKRISSESLKSTALRHPGKLHTMTASTGSMGKLDYSEYRRSRINMYVSDTELNNILNRRNSDWPTSPQRKSMEYLPMRSIENFYRSNSEENLRCRSSKNIFESRLVQQHHEPRRNSVSALKNKFECFSVVESRPSCQSNQTPTDTDTQNNSVSEIQPEKPYGEILRDGHIITSTSNMEGRGKSRRDSIKDASFHRSDANDNSEVVIDLTEASSPRSEENLSRSQAEVITISDDSVIEISDSVISEKLDISDIVVEEHKSNDNKYPEDLNPFGDEEDNKINLSVKSQHLNDSLNPFEDDDDDDADDDKINNELEIQKKATLTTKRKIIVPIDESLHEGDTPEYMRNIDVPRINESPSEKYDLQNQKKRTPTIRKKIIVPIDESFHEEDIPEYMRNIYVQKTALNPFENDEDEEEDNSTKAGDKPTPAVRKKFVTPHDGHKIENEDKIGANPFEDDEDEDDEFDNNERYYRPASATMPQKKLIPAPKNSLNPFWSDVDEDEPEYDDEDYENKQKPVPKPRKSRNFTGSGATPEPKPRTSNQSVARVIFGSNSSLSSGQSGNQSVRKKKLAPRPPILLTESKTESPAESSLTSSPSTSVSHSPRLATKARKAKKAPLPPSSTPKKDKDLESVISSIPTDLPESTKDADKDIHLEANDQKPIDHEEDWNNEKVAKDKVNENRRSQLYNLPTDLTLPDNNEYQEYLPNKSTYGKWKRKKGPAPSRPVPQRRMIKALPVSEFRKELDLIELQKQGLEKQGVRLERIIRDRCEGPDRDKNIGDSEDWIPIEVEDLILQLFEVVNEKNELSRREAELMYLQRQQRLEEEHAETEYQIRCLMMQPEVNKTDSDKAKEEELILRLVEIVERRNEIIECLEMDRLREAEEDDSISTSLNSYASRRDEQLSAGSPTRVPKIAEEELKQEEATKKSKKAKKHKSKKSQAVDADKDVDESETSITSVKEKKKKKFTLF